MSSKSSRFFSRFFSVSLSPNKSARSTSSHSAASACLHSASHCFGPDAKYFSESVPKRLFTRSRIALTSSRFSADTLSSFFGAMRA